jgi:hypothetical protein
MSVFYTIDGEVEVRDTEESHAILARLQDECGDITVDVEELGKTLRIVVGGGLMCSYTTASDLDEILRDLGPHAVRAARFATRCDDEEEVVWVGGAEDVAQAEREERMEVARRALRALEPGDREALLAEFQER